MVARFGGLILHPYRTLSSILSGQGGSLFEILFCSLVVAAAISPVRAGQCLLMARADWFEGLRRVPSFVGNQLGPPMLGALCGALILTILARSLTKNVEEERFGFDWTFDRCLDACFYMLVPFLIMASVGVILEQLGVRWWFLPHRPFRGTGIYLTVRLLLAFGWSFILFAIVVRGLWTGLAPEDPLGEAQ